MSSPAATMDSDGCAHCGLPVRGGYQSDGLSFCCYGCYLVRRVMGEEADEGPATFILARLGISGFLAMNIMMASLILYTDALEGLPDTTLTVLRYVLWVLATPVLILLATPFLVSAYHDARDRRLTMDTLVAMGSIAAYAVSAVNVVRGSDHPIYFDTATMLMVLVTVGKLLEAQAKTRTHALLKGLVKLGASHATVVRGGQEVEVPVEEVQAGDELVIRPGETIPADGVVLRGRSSVHEAEFTGESAPRPCMPGDRVYGGSLNEEGLIAVRAEGVGRDSLLGQITRIIEEARSRRAPIDRLADKVAAWFIPLVWAASIGAALYWWLAHDDPVKAGMSALAVLVVACPCALGIAAPLAISLAIGKAAGAGVLIRSPGAVEVLPTISSVYLDKTGTLTRGHMALAAVIPGPATDSSEALRVVATLEHGASHSIAKAIVRGAEARGLDLGELRELTQRPGRGVEGVVEIGGRQFAVRAGTAEWLNPSESLLGAEEDVADATQVYAEWEGGSALLLLRDAVRPEAPDVVRALREDMGLEVLVLSGDREEPTAAAAGQLGIDGYHARMTPDAKADRVEAARSEGRVVAMVGDGTNDAPALTVADVGIAMAGGTDLARDAGDITLMGDDLTRLPWLLSLTKHTCGTIRGNLVWAFGYNALMVTIAFFGLLHPLLAAILMLFSSLVVIGNSLRRGPTPRDDSEEASEPTSA